MYKKNITKNLLLLLCTLPSYSEVNLQQGVYDAAEEMIRFDLKMNRLIEEHNQRNLEEQSEMQENRVEDFEETVNGYLLKQSVDESKRMKIEVTLKDRMVFITTITKTQEVVTVGDERSYENTMSRSTSSLYLPQDADELSMRQEYKNGILEVTFLKK